MTGKSLQGHKDAITDLKWRIASLQQQIERHQDAMRFLPDLSLDGVDVDDQFYAYATEEGLRIQAVDVILGDAQVNELRHYLARYHSHRRRAR